jgi:hypothetical protein
MAGGQSAWRADDAVAYDRMRDAANMVIALLLRQGADGERPMGAALVEVAQVRRAALEVDGFDRAAVAAERERFDARAAELMSGPR